ncbi:MAG: glycosyltransferase [archaeon]
MAKKKSSTKESATRASARKKTGTPAFSFVIPAHNEGGNIAKLVKEITSVMKNLRQTFEIVVINDNSSDDSEAVIDRLAKSVPTLRQIVRRNKPGVGYAIKTGLAAAKGDLIVTLDGDRSHDPHELPRFLAKMPKYDFVCGSRRVDGGKASMTLSRILISGTFNIIFRIMLGLPVKDFTSGYRCYTKEVRDAIMPLESTGFGIYIEIPIKAHKRGFSLTEVPIIYHKREAGKTNLNYFKQGPEYIKVALKNMW